MKRSIRSAVAMAVGLGLAVPLLTAAPAEAATKVKVKSTPTIEGYQVDDAEDSLTVRFTGKVKVKKQKKACRSKRKVTLFQLDQGIVVGKDKTNKLGTWVVAFDGTQVNEGTFRIKVAKKVVKKKGKKIVCKGAQVKYAMEDIPNLDNQL